MTNPAPRDDLRSRFWERYPLTALTPREWEALCDGCGKCCLNKLEDEDTRDVAFTNVACRLLDDDTCRCSRYETRRDFVPECVFLSPKTLPDVAYWLPATCAYRLLFEGKRLYPWHPLISGRAESVHEAGVSVRGRTVSEWDVAEEDWEDYIIEEPT